MNHPFNLSLETLADIEFAQTADTAEIEGGLTIACINPEILTKGLHEIGGGCFPPPRPICPPWPIHPPRPWPRPIDPPEVTTLALGEEGGHPLPSTY